MGMVRAEITLKNPLDEGYARDGYIRQEDILLGAIPLEGLDLMVNPVTQELVGIHGDDVEYIVY